MAAAAWFFFALVVAGLHHYGLRPDGHWTPEGWARLGLFAAASAVVMAGMAALKVRHVVLAFLAVWTIYGVAAAGPAAIASVLWIVTACWALGRTLFPKVEDPMLAIALGLAGWIFLYGVLVHFPVNRPWLWGALTAAPVVVAVSRRLQIPAFPEEKDAGQRAWRCILLILLTAHFLLVLKPEVSADGLAWHLVAPARIAALGFWPFDVSEFAWAVMPMGGDWVWSLTWLFGEEKGARLMNFALLALSTALVSTRAGIGAAALWASTPLVMLATGSLFVENVWAFLLLAAFLIAWGREPHPWAVALLAGSACAVKLLAVPMAVPIVVWAMWRSREWRPAVVFLATGTMPYVEAIVRTGNPFFPYLNGIFKSPLYPSDANLKDLRYTQTLNWRSLWDMTFRTNLFCESPGGGFGFQWLALMPVAAVTFIRRRDPIMRAALVLGAAEVVVVFLGQPYIRYMYAALLLWTLAIGNASDRPSWKWLMAAVSALNLLYFASAGWYHRDFIIEPLTERSRMAAYAAQLAPLTPLIEHANRELPGESVAFISGDGAGRLRARAWVNTWHGGHFARELSQAATTDDMRRLLESRRVRRWIGFSDERPELFPTVASWGLSTSAQSLAERRSGDWAIYRLLDAPAPSERRYSGPGMHDELNRSVRLKGRWFRDRQFPEAYQSTLVYCDQANCEAEFDFEGRAVTLVYTRTFNRGQAEVRMDGKPVARLDQYGPRIDWQQRVRFDAGAPGRHTLGILVLGLQSPGSGGAHIDIDAFEVE
ncbi:MAG TPA: hypothetical protein VLH09_12850 [Bryobacteraceae bacterium]|nr:hypothetical protein [Bryobacteraceae bacterium]